MSDQPPHQPHWQGRWRQHPYYREQPPNTLDALRDHLYDEDAIIHKSVLEHDGLPAHQHFGRLSEPKEG